MIISITYGSTGDVGRTPRRVSMTVNDSLVTVTTANYLSENGVMPFFIYPTDIFDVIYNYNTASNTGTYIELIPIIAGGVITLTPVVEPDSWVRQTTASVNMVANTGYTSDAGATLVTYHLPTVAGYGDWVEINGKGSGLYTIAQAAGQQIILATQSTTLGISGSVSSQIAGNNIRLRCITPNTIWTAVSEIGSFTVV